MMTKRMLLSLVVCTAMVGAAWTLPKTGYQDPATLEKLIRTGSPACLLIDCRSQARYEAGHIATAINLPVGVLDSRLPASEKDSLIVVYGESAGEGARGQEILRNLGYRNVVCFEGFGWWMGGLSIGAEPGAPSPVPGYGPNDDEMYSVACNAMRTDDLSVAKEFIRMMKVKDGKFEDIYFSINCGNGPGGLMFHNSSSVIVSRALLNSLRAYEKSTGKTVVEPILNRLFPHYLFSGAPNQTPLDYLGWRKEGTSSDGLRKFYQELMDLYPFFRRSASRYLPPKPSATARSFQILTVPRDGDAKQLQDLLL